MTQTERELKQCLQNIFWMARRYANGRHTTVPSTVRMWYRILKTKYPDIKIERDEVIAEDAQKQRGLKSGFDLPSDWLDDCND